MSSAYKEAKPGRLVFKGGEAASLDKKKKRKKKTKTQSNPLPSDDPSAEETTVDPSASASGSKVADGGGDVYTIDAAKKLKYEELFPVESKKYNYDPKNASRSVSVKRSVEEALDDRVKKKADRYCK
ncbi:hypothetical protein LUZ63_002834 [Rhynchospora breviuscula]|uniref:Uncharacterized protein n=1 Tax=Rhynchospora breviuscula TaxID=2022672 RepID=A0A9Q0D016_9POAL|nr:hypothetical protein LUZ63_002834 [Rhynchospora breviuscula]